MPRHRLRFLLQELDLPFGETLIGRSPTCRITIEDPLVSRQHARIVVDGGGARFEDLGSRNGSKINGVTTRGAVALSDGDRIRVGTMEFVFCRLDTQLGADGKITGLLRHCSSCGTPYPAEMPACAHCGAVERQEEDTMTGLSADPRRGWSVQLAVEVFAKAVALGNDAYVDRMSGRAREAVDARVAEDGAIDGATIDALALAMGQVIERRRDAGFAAWLLGIYATVGRLPPASFLDKLRPVPADRFAASAPALESIAARARAAGDADTASRVAVLLMRIPPAG